jgi:UDP:flavonoid glycosyltransferase YjiC (YdhE family)
LSGLGDVLVVTVRKSFWASEEAERWPRRLYARVYHGHSTALVNAVPAFARALISIWMRPPKIVLLGSVERMVPWFIHMRRRGLLRGAKLVVTNQLNLTPMQLEYVDCVIVYARAQAAALEPKGAFLPLPADGDFEAARRSAEPGGYVFSGGGAGRDFGTLIEAMDGADTALHLVVFDRDQLGDVPPNVVVSGPLPQLRFLTEMAGASVVVVPVAAEDAPHGQTTLVQALALERPLVATRSVGVVDYVEAGREGLLVEPRDADGLRAAILRLLGDEELRAECSRHAGMRARQLSYAHFADGLADVCSSVRDDRTNRIGP